MPRKRFTNAEALDLVKAKIAAAGGKITHKALITQLDAEGNGQIALNIAGWAQKQGPLVPDFDFTVAPDERLSYSVREGLVN